MINLVIPLCTSLNFFSQRSSLLCLLALLLKQRLCFMSPSFSFAYLVGSRTSGHVLALKGRQLIQHKQSISALAYLGTYSSSGIRWLVRLDSGFGHRLTMVF